MLPLKFREPAGEFPGGLWPRCRVFRQAIEHDLIERGADRQFRPGRRTCRGTPRVMREQGECGWPVEDLLAGEQPVRDASNRVDIGPPVHRGTEDLLRRHEGGGSRNHIVRGAQRCRGRGIVIGLHNAEVEHFYEVVFFTVPPPPSAILTGSVRR